MKFWVRKMENIGMYYPSLISIFKIMRFYLSFILNDAFKNQHVHFLSKSFLIFHWELIKDMPPVIKLKWKTDITVLE